MVTSFLKCQITSNTVTDTALIDEINLQFLLTTIVLTVNINYSFNQNNCNYLRIYLYALNVNKRIIKEYIETLHDDWLLCSSP